MANTHTLIAKKSKGIYRKNTMAQRTNLSNVKWVLEIDTIKMPL